MLKQQETHALKFLQSPKNIALLALATIIIAFIGYKAWQEYLIHQINQAVQTYPTASGGTSERIISWGDDATNEDGYKIERRQVDSSEYQNIAIVAANSTNYSDAAALPEGEYCYRIAAFNQAGESYSDDSCLTIYDTNSGSGQAPATSIVTNFIERTGVIELDGREFYSFKSDYPYNQDFSIDEVNDLDFAITKGRLVFKDARAFVFKEQGEVLDKGFAKIRFHELNSIHFSLNGNGEQQVATLYLSMGIWDEESTEGSLIITAGEETHTIELPSRGILHYVAINISFDQYTPVTIQPTGRHKGKNSIKVAGVILNLATLGNTKEEPLTNDNGW